MWGRAASHSARAVVGVASLVAVASVMSSCGAADVDDGSAGDHVDVPAPMSTISATEASAQLASLPRQIRPHGSDGYTRAAFGPAWTDVDGNGCNQRDDVLLRDAVIGTVRVQRRGRCDHDVIAGSWIDPYTGGHLVFDNLKDLHQAEAIQIDHVVPLAEASVSGASVWSAKRRLRYANDLDDLVASSGPVNASKGSDDPAAWRPKEAYQCSYATRWIAIKHRWELAVDESEFRALEEMLSTCAS